MMGKLVLLFVCFTIAYVNAKGKVTECVDFPGVGVLKANETKPVKGTCNIATCHEDGTISQLTCPDFFVLPPCKKLPGDSSKLYPGCCPKSWCPPKKTVATK